MKKRIIQLSFIIILLVVIYIRITHEESKPIKETRFALGTFVTIDIQDKQGHNKEIIDSVFALIQQLEEQFSSTHENSETNILNSCKDSIAVSENMYELLRISENISNETEGAFDITVGKILPYYDFIINQMPSEEMIDSLKPCIDHNKINIENHKYKKENPGIIIDFGGIAKGYIVERAASYLKEKGIKHAAINAGGDLYVMRNPETDTWKIGIQHPRKSDNLLGSIDVKNMAVVTSGDYEQYFMMDGERIHHIIDPSTGLPSHKSVSVTVITPSPTQADAICTALFVMGPEKGMKFVDGIQDIEALIVYNDDSNLSYVLSENFDKYAFTLLDSTVQCSKDFK